VIYIVLYILHCGSSEALRERCRLDICHTSFSPRVGLVLPHIRARRWIRGGVKEVMYPAVCARACFVVEIRAGGHHTRLQN
jgi:hypothetical protein